ncbi:hypothetical protein A2V82_14545 [candidate division KSB1 bacterium RBG_16_48_16]|nr:MAG: hypothetical protein A2V82_14545 [candidate division KSB1 bacterium RBG_16_48_16]
MNSNDITIFQKAIFFQINMDFKSLHFVFLFFRFGLGLEALIHCYAQEWNSWAIRNPWLSV